MNPRRQHLSRLSRKFATLSACFVILMLAGCRPAINLGPTEKIVTVVVKPGNPLLILDNKKVRGRLLKDDKEVQQDIGGWVAMPQEHWEQIKKVLEKNGPVGASLWIGEKAEIVDLEDSPAAPAVPQDWPERPASLPLLPSHGRPLAAGE